MDGQTNAPGVLWPELLAQLSTRATTAALAELQKALDDLAKTVDSSIDVSKITGTLPVAKGGTGLTTSPSLLVNLASTAAASAFGASPRPGVTGTLPVKNGGTGLTTSPSLLVNLASTAAASAFGASPRPGVTGVLPVARGGTGVTSLEALVKQIPGANIAAGTYVGTHTYGADNPTSLTFDSEPIWILIQACPANHSRGIWTFPCEGLTASYMQQAYQNSGSTPASTANPQYLYAKKEGNTVSWYSTYDANLQANYYISGYPDMRYQWIAFLKGEG